MSREKAGRATEQYYATKNYENRKGILVDAINAKTKGVSYGKYKAGIKPDIYDEDGEYAVSHGGYISKRVDDESGIKPKAYIRAFG